MVNLIIEQSGVLILLTKESQQAHSFSRLIKQVHLLFHLVVAVNYFSFAHEMPKCLNFSVMLHVPFQCE